MRNEEYREIKEKMREDRVSAEKALLGEKTNDIAREAAFLVEKKANRKEKCLIEARRAAQKIKNSRGGWVIQTQLQYIHQAELAGLNEKDMYLSESQIKRKWRQLVSLTKEIAGYI